MPNISKIQLPNDVVYDIADKISGYVNATGAANAAPVQSVNGSTGTVVLTAADVGALPSDTSIPSKISDLTNDQIYDLGALNVDSLDMFVPTEEQHTAIAQMWNRGLCALTWTENGQPYLSIKQGVITVDGGDYYFFTGTWASLDYNGASMGVTVIIMPSIYQGYGLRLTLTLPNKISDLDNDSGFITTETDPTVPSWAKASTKPSYTASEVGALPNTTVIPSKTSDLTNDSGFITGMTILSYGNSTWQDFLSAYNSNQVIYCRASSNSNPASGSQTRLAFMAYVSDATSPTNVEFQYYRSMSSHSATQQGDEVYVYKLTSAGAWTVTVRKASPNIVAGTGLSRSYSNDTVTLSLDGTIPTKTSDLTNDSGYLTLSTLPIYDGTVIIGT